MKPQDDAVRPPVMRGQPKARLFQTLSLLWLFPSGGAVYILVRGMRQWPRVEDGLGGIVLAMTFEQWIAVLLLGLHALFMVLAWRFRRTEPCRDMEPYEPSEPGNEPERANHSELK